MTPEQVLSIKPNRNDVLSRGHICPKAVALKDVHEDPDSLRTPVRRTPARSANWRSSPSNKGSTDSGSIPATSAPGNTSKKLSGPPRNGKFLFASASPQDR